MKAEGAHGDELQKYTTPKVLPKHLKNLSHNHREMMVFQRILEFHNRSLNVVARSVFPSCFRTFYNLSPRYIKRVGNCSINRNE